MFFWEQVMGSGSVRFSIPLVYTNGILICQLKKAHFPNSGHQEPTKFSSPGISPEKKEHHPRRAGKNEFLSAG
jgi:hypothetical protein